MKKPQNPSWLKQDLVNQGLTATVVKYLSGKLKNLDSVKDLTWKEFFFIYFSEGNAFEKSDFFKKKLQPFLTMKGNKAGEILMQQIQEIIKDIPNAKRFFRQRIPVPFAITLCDDSWDASQLWDDAKIKHEKRLILDKVLELFATCTIERDTLKSYWNMTKEFPEDRKIVHALIGSLITIDTYQAYLLAKEIPFSDNQISALVMKISEDKAKRIHLRECLSLYGKTRHPLIIPLLEKLVPEETNPCWVLTLIEETVDEVSSQDQEFFKKSLFPLFDSILRKVGIDDYLRREGSSVISHLPKYEEGDPVIEGFLDEVIKYYHQNEYRLTFDRFLSWYGYAPKEQFLDLYLDGLGRHGCKVFTGAIAVFKLCNDNRILKCVIKEEIPKLSSIDEDLLAFIDWLEKENHSSYLNYLENTILENNCLDKWLTNVSGQNKHGMVNFLKLATRFK